MREAVSRRGARRTIPLLIAAVACAVVGMNISAMPAHASADSMHTAVAARPNMLTQSAGGAVSPNVPLGTWCVWNAEEVKTDSLYAYVSCTAPVTQIFFTVFGEDSRNDITWETTKTCSGTNACSGVWKGSSADVSQTACVEVHYPTGNPAILADCITVKV